MIITVPAGVQYSTVQYSTVVLVFQKKTIKRDERETSINKISIKSHIPSYDESDTLN
jgi:hypothetical protein